MTCYKALGHHVRQRRRHLQITQRELAERCDLSRSYITGIEQGYQKVLLETVYLLARALHCTVHDLITASL